MSKTRGTQLALRKPKRRTKGILLIVLNVGYVHYLKICIVFQLILQLMCNFLFTSIDFNLFSSFFVNYYEIEESYHIGHFYRKLKCEGFCFVVCTLRPNPTCILMLCTFPPDIFQLPCPV